MNRAGSTKSKQVGQQFRPHKNRKKKKTTSKPFHSPMLDFLSRPGRYNYENRVHPIKDLSSIEAQNGHFLTLKDTKRRFLTLG